MPSDSFENDWQELHYSNNKITEIPAEISTLANTLTILYLSNNYISEVPPQIGTLRFLEELFLPGNRLTNLPTEIGYLSNLKILNVADNSLTALPPSIGGLKKLERIMVRGNDSLSFPPKNIWTKGTNAILSFLQDFGKTQEEAVYGLNNIQTDFKLLLQSKTLTDVTVESEGNQLPAHRVILAARSAYFRDILSKKSDEKLPVTISLTRTPFALLLKVIQWMYTDNIEFSSIPYAEEICNIATKLQVDKQLIEICQIYITGSMKPNPPHNLSDNMSHFIDNKELSDLILRIEDEPIPCHKIVLCRCEYFRALLSSGFKESQAQELDVNHISVPLFKQILTYLYSDNVELINPDNAIELLTSTTQFVGLERLKRKCEHYLTPLIDEENCVYLYQVADHHSASVLAAHVSFFILTHLEAASKNELWNDLKKSQRDEILLKAERWGIKK